MSRKWWLNCQQNKCDGVCLHDNVLMRSGWIRDEFSSCKKSGWDCDEVYEIWMRSVWSGCVVMKLYEVWLSEVVKSGMMSGWSMYEVWTKSEWSLAEVWTRSAWNLCEVCMKSGGGLYEIWMRSVWSGWSCDEVCMKSGWKPD